MTLEALEFIRRFYYGARTILCGYGITGCITPASARTCSAVALLGLPYALSVARELIFGVADRDSEHHLNRCPRCGGG